MFSNVGEGQLFRHKLGMPRQSIRVFSIPAAATHAVRLRSSDSTTAAEDAAPLQCFL